MANERSITPNEPADFTPELGNYKTLRPFRYWCQKVLPLVYDDSLSYYELLCKVVDYLNKSMEDIETLHGDVTNLHTAYEELQSYVNDYFSTLDVQEEINNKLDTMVTDGTLETIIGGKVTYAQFLNVAENSSVGTSLLNVVKSWLDNTDAFTYGHNGAVDLNKPITTDAQGRYYIDCSTLTELVMMGCPFEGSRYAGNSTNIKLANYGFRYYGTNEEAIQGSMRYTYQQAEWFYNHGYARKPSEWMDDFQLGDVLYITSNTSSPTNPDKFMQIDHCMIYLCEYGSLGYKICLNVSFNEENPINIRLYNPNDGVSALRLVCRFPLGGSNNDGYSILNDINGNTFYLSEKPITGEWYTVNVNADVEAGGHLGFTAFGVTGIWKTEKLGVRNKEYTYTVRATDTPIVGTVNLTKAKLNKIDVFRGYKVGSKAISTTPATYADAIVNGYGVNNFPAIGELSNVLMVRKRANYWFIGCDEKGYMKLYNNVQNRNNPVMILNNNVLTGYQKVTVNERLVTGNVHIDTSNPVQFVLLTEITSYPHLALGYTVDSTGFTINFKCVDTDNSISFPYTTNIRYMAFTI